MTHLLDGRPHPPDHPSSLIATRVGGRGSDGADELERAVRDANVAESASDAVVGISPDGVIATWGERAERLFGYETAEAVGRPVTLLASPEHTRTQGELIARVLAGRRVERLEIERTGKDGRRLSLLLSLSAVHTRDGRAAGVLGVFRDISAQREAEAALQASERRYQSVVEALSEGIVVQDRAGRVLASNHNAEQILELPVGALEQRTVTPADWSLVDEDGSPVSIENLPGRRCLRTGQAQRGVVLGVRMAGEIRRWLSADSTPLVDPGESKPHAAVTSLTDITALRKTITELQTARLEDLERLALVGEYRDDDTFRHTERVGRSAELVAIELGLDSDRAWTIRRAAPLHDVGKIGIPDAILLKPGALTPEEFDVIKTHTTIGQRILGKSHAPVLSMAAEIAATHHERWDGNGYPFGLRAHEIPIVGRIVAVADTFDAITHTRPYKTASPITQAVAEIERCSGSQFDPDVVRAFKRVEHTQLVDSD
jgi:putative two-component system response regulator